MQYFQEFREIMQGFGVDGEQIDALTPAALAFLVGQYVQVRKGVNRKQRDEERFEAFAREFSRVQLQRDRLATHLRSLGTGERQLSELLRLPGSDESSGAASRDEAEVGDITRVNRTCVGG